MQIGASPLHSSLAITTPQQGVVIVPGAKALELAQQNFMTAMGATDRARLDGLLPVPAQYASFSAFVAAGGGRIPAGTYEIDPLHVTWPVTLIFERGARLKWKSAPAPGFAALLRLAPGAEDSLIGGPGVFDGNEQTHGAGWSYVTQLRSWHGLVVEAARCRILDGLQFERFIGFGAMLTGDDLDAGVMTFRNCGHAYFAGRDELESVPLAGGGLRQTIAPARCDDIGLMSRDYDIFQHVVDIIAAQDGDYGGAQMFRHASARNGRSAFTSGLTAERCVNTQFQRNLYHSPAAEAHVHLGMSYVSCRDCLIEGDRAINFAGLGFEAIGGTNNRSIECHVDGQYRATLLRGVARAEGNAGSFGFSYNFQGYTARKQSRESSAAAEWTFVDAVARRCNTGGWIRGTGSRWYDPEFRENAGHGAIIEQWRVTDVYAGAQPIAGDNQLSGVRSEGNGFAGLWLGNNRRVMVDHGRIANNGFGTPERAAVIAPAGIHAASGATVAFLSALNVSYDSMSSWSGKVVSWKPQTLASASDPARIEIENVNNDLMRIGQKITVSGLVTDGVETPLWVQDIIGDTLICAPQQAVLSGTWTATPGGAALTGSGGAALSQVTTASKIWLAGAWRSVAAVSGNNAITLAAALPDTFSDAPVSGLIIKALTPITLRHASVALAGTFSSSGTTLTGSGSALVAAAPGPIWITNGVEWRKIVAVSSNTAAVLDQAFSTPLSGASLTACQSTAAMTQPQTHAIAAAGTITTFSTHGSSFGNIPVPFAISVAKWAGWRSPAKIEGPLANDFTLTNTGVWQQAAVWPAQVFGGGPIRMSARLQINGAANTTMGARFTIGGVAVAESAVRSYLTGGQYLALALDAMVIREGSATPVDVALEVLQVGGAPNFATVRALDASFGSSFVRIEELAAR